MQARLDLWIKAHIDKLLGPLSALAAAEDVTGIARGVAYRLIEDLGVLERQKVADDVKGLDQGSRAALRKYGLRFGAYHLYVPPLLKPAPRALATLLYAIKNDSDDMRGLDEVQVLASSGRTSIPANKDVPKNLYRVAGYRVAGERAVRVDILERLADLIRPALAWRNNSPGVKPQGALDGTGFTVTVGMTSLVGSSGEDFASILRSLGYRMERRPKPPEAVSPPQTIEAELAPQPAESGAADGIENSTTEIANDNTPVAAAEGDSGRAIEPEPVVSDPVAEPQQSAGTEDQQTIADSSASAETASAEPATTEPASAESADTVTASGMPDSGASANSPSDSAPSDGEPSEGESVGDAAGETASVEAAAPDIAGDAPVVAAEPELIEVWRPGRFESREKRPPRKHHRREHQGAQRSPAGPQSAASEGAPAGEQAASGTNPAPQERRQDHRQDHRPQGPRPPRNDRSGRQRRHEGGQDAQRHGKPDNRPRHQDARPRPERREREPDPNSPFAKLAALKAQLEADSKERR